MAVDGDRRVTGAKPGNEDGRTHGRAGGVPVQQNRVVGGLTGHEWTAGGVGALADTTGVVGGRFPSGERCRGGGERGSREAGEKRGRGCREAKRENESLGF